MEVGLVGVDAAEQIVLRMARAQIDGNVLGERHVLEHRHLQLAVYLTHILRASRGTDQIVGWRDGARGHGRGQHVERRVQARVGVIGEAVAAVIDAQGELELALRESPERAAQVPFDQLLADLVGVVCRALGVGQAPGAHRLRTERIPRVARAVLAIGAMVVREAV